MRWHPQTRSMGNHSIKCRGCGEYLDQSGCRSRGLPAGRPVEERGGGSLFSVRRRKGRSLTVKGLAYWYIVESIGFHLFSEGFKGV